MKTKFNIDEEIYVKGKVIGISIDENGISYTVDIDNVYLDIPEEDAYATSRE